MKIILFAVSLLLCLASCDKNAKGRGGKKEKLILVKAQLVKAESLPQHVPMVAVLQGRRQAQVYSRVAGRISFLGAPEGKKVKERDILFRVDRSDPGESFLATPVLSPITGWVGRWLVTSIGSQVSAQEPVVTVVDDEQLIARVLLPTEEWLKVSSETVVRVQAGRETRNAKVIGITRSAETLSSRGTISVEIENNDHVWKAGMVAVVTFDLDQRNRIILPAAALSITDQGSFVFVIREGKAHRLPVTFDVIDNDQVEILEGLKEAELVVTQGVNQLGDGLKVKVIENGKGS